MHDAVIFIGDTQAAVIFVKAAVNAKQTFSTVWHLRQ
jgi:hypothetical protein